MKKVDDEYEGSQISSPRSARRPFFNEETKTSSFEEGACIISLSSPSYAVLESAGHVSIPVHRDGNTELEVSDP